MPTNCEIKNSHCDENGFLFPYEDWDSVKCAPKNIADRFQYWLVENPYYFSDNNNEEAWDQFMVEQINNRDGEWSNKLAQEKPEYLAHKSEIDFGNEQFDMARPWSKGF